MVRRLFGEQRCLILLAVGDIERAVKYAWSCLLEHYRGTAESGAIEAIFCGSTWHCACKLCPSRVVVEALTFQLCILIFEMRF